MATPSCSQIAADGGTSSATSTTATGHCPAAVPGDGSACAQAKPASDPPVPANVSVDEDQCWWPCASARCNSGAWSSTASDPPCAWSQPAYCPDAAPEPGTACSDANQPYCRYPGGTRCGCFDCLPYGAPCTEHVGKQWACAAPAAGCPLDVADTGSPCATEGLFCAYGPEPCSGIAQVCAQGEWWSTVRVCPM